MAQFVRKSRLERKADEQITKRTIVLGLVTILFLVFLVVLGIPALVRLAVFLGDMKNKNQQTVTDVTLPPLAPRLFVPFDATNSATISVNGTAEAKTSVELMKNDSFLDKTDVTDSGDFNFDNVTLDKGENKFTAVAVSPKGVRSEVSKDLVITYNDQPPSLTMTAPNQDSVTVDTADYDITGKSDPGVSVTVNGRVAMVENDGSFKLKVQLNQGKNDFEIIATDNAGNQTKKTVSVTYDF
ncbi:Ig-like domain-containing protein [Patescibacteria group bacterium]|nr:Ig-like domain-containing protein [Patescibacteria group bacterium]